RIVDGGAAFLWAFGGNQHHAKRPPCTINCRRCSIFQHADAFDVVRIQEGRVPFDPINKDKGTPPLADGCTTTHIERCRPCRLPIFQRDIQVGHGTLQCLRRIGGRTIFEHFTSHGFDGPCKIYLSLCSITYYDHFFEALIIDPEGYVDVPIVADGPLNR